MCMCPMYRWRFDELFTDVQYRVCYVLFRWIYYGLCNNNVQKPNTCLLPPPSLYIPSSHSILFHSIIYSTTVHTTFISQFIFQIFVYLYLHMCNFYSHRIFIVCVVVVSVYWKFMTLKQMPCSTSILGNKALSDSDSGFVKTQIHMYANSKLIMME